MDTILVLYVYHFFPHKETAESTNNIPIKVLPHLPPYWQRWGFDLILTTRHALDQGDLNKHLQN